MPTSGECGEEIGQCTDGTDHWLVWHVPGFGIEESDDRAKVAEEAGQEVRILYGR